MNAGELKVSSSRVDQIIYICVFIACQPGKWGKMCSNTCSCNSDNSDYTNKCAQENGQCSCKDGYEGISCDKGVLYS